MSDLAIRRFISIAEIQQAVAAAFSLTRADLLSRNREQRVACARHVAMYLSRELARGEGRGSDGALVPPASYPRIGMAFGRDHTSVMHACNSIGRRCRADQRFARMVDGIAHDVRIRVDHARGKVAA
ncbi:MAG TPA: helix-turn-helix domain-containing protein [Candidatus Binataceae bacterium]|nr:helix-turn-helix domain-containing protein [Candidatus Binataceae bacterium]